MIKGKEDNITNKKNTKNFGAQAHEAHVIHSELHSVVEKEKKWKSRQIITDKQALKCMKWRNKGEERKRKKNAQ